MLVIDDVEGPPISKMGSSGMERRPQRKRGNESNNHFCTNLILKNHIKNLYFRPYM